MRVQLTLICMLGTLLVLAGAAAASLSYSLRQLEAAMETSLRGNTNAVLFYLQSSDTIDHTWLARTEAAEGLVIYMEYEGSRLDYGRVNAGHSAVADAALETAQREFSALWQPGAAALGARTELFSFSAGGQSYRAAACLLPREGRLYRVIVSKSNATQEAQKTRLLLAYGFGSLGAALLLGLFAWFFSGRAVRPAVAAGQQQQEFLSAASHELRSPLAVIRLSAGSIKTLPEEAPRLADKIERECGRMGGLIQDFLLLSGSAAGMRVQPAPVSPQTLLLNTCERFEDIAAEKGISLVPRLEGVGPPTVQWDAARIEQALAVLVDNALSYSPPGGSIAVRLYAKGGMVEFSVEDSGPGIPEAEREKVFERFYRADASRSGKEHYGLGLSVAREIARLHGGRLTAGKSKQLGGAAFQLRLPLASAQ